MDVLKDFKKYRWFYTSSGKLVVGGKSAMQNDELLSKLKAINKELIVMHTSEPGSPFTVILDEKTSQKDIEEAAHFTGSFSRAWKLGKKNTIVDIFSLSQLSKSSIMKTGTWGVIGKVKHSHVEIKLVLTLQEGILRAVSPQTPKKKDIFLTVQPGKIDKVKMAPLIKENLPSSISIEEILSALPAGGVSITKD